MKMSYENKPSFHNEELGKLVEDIGNLPLRNTNDSLRRLLNIILIIIPFFLFTFVWIDFLQYLFGNPVRVYFYIAVPLFVVTFILVCQQMFSSD